MAETKEMDVDDREKGRERERCSLVVPLLAQLWAPRLNCASLG